MPISQHIATRAILLPEHLMRKDTTLLNLGSLIASIAAKGLIHPVSVFRLPDGQFELAAGHRRLLAHIEMAREFIPAMVYEPGEADPEEIMSAENFHRTEINPVEEAEWYAYIQQKHHISAAEVARRCEVEYPRVLKALSLLEGTEAVQEALRGELISVAQAIEINKVKDQIGQKIALEYARGNGFSAVAIKAWREGRERTGVDMSMAEIQTIVEEGRPPSSMVSLLCQFCTAYHPLQNVHTWQVCNDCASGLAKGLELLTAAGENP